MIVVAAAVVLVAGSGGAAWKTLRSLPYAEPEHQTILPVSAAREMAYVDRYWQHGNTTAFGSFGGTDCVNFTSQALLARGWPMTAEWGHSQRLGLNQYTKTSVSSTALERYLAAHPELAVAVEDTQRDRLRVGDIAQFDWDDSGDRRTTPASCPAATTGEDGPPSPPPRTPGVDRVALRRDRCQRRTGRVRRGRARRCGRARPG